VSLRSIYLVCGALFAFGSAISQANSPYRNLVFEGAGIRGIAYSGVIKELETRKILTSIENVGGTSAGAITAMMLSLGYTSEEIFKIIADTKFEKFNDGQYFFIGGMHRFKKRYGWYRSKAFTKWLETIIEQKTGNADIRFSELKDRGFKNLYVTATCLNQQKLVVLSAANYPTMKIKDAVRISMSVPFYFEASFVDSVGTIIEKPKNSAGLDIMVDGGILGNFPIFIFDQQTLNSKGINERVFNTSTIGIRIDTDEQIAQDKLNPQLTPVFINKLSDYVQAFYNIVLENLNRNQLAPEDWQRTISVSNVGIGPKIKRLSQKQKLSLMESGEKAAREYFERSKS